MKQRKVLKRRYKGAKVLHARRYRPRVQPNAREYNRKVCMNFLRQCLYGWEQ